MKKFFFSLLAIILSMCFLETAQRIRYYHRYKSTYWLKYGMVGKPKDYDLMQERGRDANIIETSLVYYDRYCKYNPNNKRAGEHINSMGFRGKEIGEKHKYRIVALGGSTTYGAGVKDGFTYPEYLEKKLNVEVINAGICEANIENIINLFEKEIIQIEPDMIIVNNIANNLLTSRHLYNFNRLEKINQLLLDKSLFYMTFREKIKVMLKKPIIDLYTVSDKVVCEKFMNDDEFYENLKQNYKKLIKLASTNNIKVIIIKEPSWIENDRRGIIMKTNFTPIWEKLYNLLDEIGEEENIQVIDVSDMPKSKEYFIDGLHLTEKGNEFLAEKIAQSLQ